MKNHPDETRARRTVRALAALSTLPAVRVGYQPLEVAESLVEVLQSTLRLDLVYLRLRGAADGSPFEVARSGRVAHAASDAREIGRALAPWLDGPHAESTTLPNVVGCAALRMVRVPPGWKDDDWALVAGSRRAGFPTNEEWLLLGVGANHAALVFQRQRADVALRQAHARLELGIRGSNIGVWELELSDGVFRNGRVGFTNVFELLGYESPDLSSDFATRMTLVHHDDRDRLEAAIQDYLSGDTQDLEVEHRARHADGSYRWMLTRGVAIRNEGGVPVCLVGSCIDITGQKQTEDALRESQERLAADLTRTKRLQALSTRLVHDFDSGRLLEEIVDAAIEITAADMGSIQLLDRGTGTLQFVASRGLGREFLDRFSTVQEGRDTWGATMESSERVVVDDVTGNLFVGEDLEVMLAAGARAVQSTPLIGRAGQRLGILTTHYREPRILAERDLGMLDVLARQAADWIERTESEEALRLAKEAAEAANRAKDEFLANVSHEIRNPLSALLGMTELVLETDLTEDQRQCLTPAKSAAESLLGLVNDLLDFEKSEAGKLALDPAGFQLRATLGDTVRTLAVRARHKGLELTCSVEPDVPDDLVGDASRLRQVLVNLVGNAIKFTNRGGVAVRVEGTQDPALECETVVRFAVIDTGIGVPPEGRERIFQAFEQGDSSSTRRYGGTGLGLTIAAQLVDLMDGQIDVESEPGRGSTFAFTARFGRPSQSSEETANRPLESLDALLPAANVTPLRILVAEDSEFNARHLDRLLTRRGHSVRIATDGRKALEHLGAETFDLLLLDVHMPELDGFQVVQAIRERATRSDLPVVALTARARQEDHDRCLEAGMDDYLSKPVRSAELFATIDRVLTAHGVPRSELPDPGLVRELLDPDVVLDGCGGESVGLTQLCEDFRTYAPGRLADVGDALRAGDAPRLREAAHRLRGLVTAFSRVAGQVASDLEDVSARGRLEEARPLFERLEVIARELDRQMEDLSIEHLRRRVGAAGA